MVAASIRYADPRIEVVERTELFETGSFRWNWPRNYDVHPSGREFVMVGGSPTRAVVRVDAVAVAP